MKRQLRLYNFLTPGQRIRWSGWETTISQLLDHLWQVELYTNPLSPHAYESLLPFRNISLGETLVLQLRPKGAPLLGKVCFSATPPFPTVLEIEQFTLERNGKTKKPVLDTPETSYSLEDTPALLGLVAEFLEPSRKTLLQNHEDAQMSSAEIIEFEKYLVG